MVIRIRRWGLPARRVQWVSILAIGNAIAICIGEEWIRSHGQLLRIRRHVSPLMRALPRVLAIAAIAFLRGAVSRQVGAYPWPVTCAMY